MTNPPPTKVRGITERQYEVLRTYEHGHPSWRFYAPSRAMTEKGLLARTPNSGQTRVSSAFQITEKGREALEAFRERYGLERHP